MQLDLIELRAAGRRLEGYAAVFNVPAKIGGRFREIVLPGAFTRSLARGSDVLALVDHDPTRLLGRTSSGTLRLAEDTRGLHFEIDAPDTQLGRDIITLAERRDLGGMSFAFRATSETWPERDCRELRAVDLVEVSIAQAFPAYVGTTVAARASAIGAELWGVPHFSAEDAVLAGLASDIRRAAARLKGIQ